MATTSRLVISMTPPVNNEYTSSGPPNTTPNGIIGDIRERVAKLEEANKSFATKSWILAGVIGGIVVTASIAITIVKLFQ